MYQGCMSLALITTRKSIHGFPFLSYEYGAPLGGPLGGQNSAIIIIIRTFPASFAPEKLGMSNNFNYHSMHFFVIFIGR